MGRRSLHTAEELRELIITASTNLIREAGLEGLSAREIARRINYSPGTLYNSFENLDDLLLTIEGRLLDELLTALAAVPRGGTPGERVQKLAGCYLAFAVSNAKLWSLIFEHHLPASQSVPETYRRKLEALVETIESALQPLVPDRSPDAAKRSARALWASVHGIASLSATEKLSILAPEDAGAVVDDLVLTYLNGLQSPALGRTG